jgi:transcriptional regulator with XRE-family HTH domain
MTSWKFDPVRLATTLRGARQERSWSTRQLAERAGVSQSYIAVLERPAEHPQRDARVPTVTVLAQLAGALQMTPSQLLDQVITTPVQHHVLLVYDDVDPVIASNAALTMSALPTPDAWVTTCTSPAARHHIDLRRTSTRAARTYDPTAVAKGLGDEWAAHASALSGSVGLVVTQQSAALRTAVSTTALLAFERVWPDTVHNCTSSAHASVSWNVCAYRADDLDRTPRRNHVLRALVDNHDLVWHATGTHVSIGDEAIRRLHPTSSKGRS